MSSQFFDKGSGTVAVSIKYFFKYQGKIYFKINLEQIINLLESIVFYTWRKDIYFVIKVVLQRDIFFYEQK